ncbi:hypothetical protein CGCF415_v006046 [Colletotrichum fructicola]|nr:hypothetical protein CGCF415_v006046 [Colletotrichum fructicola]KAF4934177.1 hypothetical protein CGCF245_v008863 [Colletotrichum fructicola]KAF5493030.1 hypothetical protein CGCF413_v010025 [Colletotrichum fructicola]
MLKMSIEAILAVIAILIAIPPAVLAYVQWRGTRSQLRVMHLPVWSADGPPYPPDEYQLDFLMIRAQGRGHFSNSLAEIMPSSCRLVPDWNALPVVEGERSI